MGNRRSGLCGRYPGRSTHLQPMWLWCLCGLRLGHKLNLSLIFFPSGPATGVHHSLLRILVSLVCHKALQYREDKMYFCVQQKWRRIAIQESNQQLMTGSSWKHESVFPLQYISYLFLQYSSYCGLMGKLFTGSGKHIQISSNIFKLTPTEDVVIYRMRFEEAAGSILLPPSSLPVIPQFLNFLCLQETPSKMPSLVWVLLKPFQSRLP